MKTLHRIVGPLILALTILCVGTASASNTTWDVGTSSNVQAYESSSGWVVAIKTPSLAAAAGDTLRARIDVSKMLLPYVGASSVPTVKYYVTTYHGVQAGAVTAADSSRIGVSWGFPGVVNKTTGIKDIFWVTSFLAKTDGSGIPQQDKVMNAKTPTDFAGARIMEVLVVNKHATLARQFWVIVTFPRMPVIEIERPAY